MKVLDLGCGKGGWSIPFIEDGDEVWGYPIARHVADTVHSLVNTENQP